MQTAGHFQFLCNERKKRVEPELLEFGRLPPRVIVHDILTYHIFDLEDEVLFCTEKKDMDDVKKKKISVMLFGYFKKDPMRNAWMLFTSIQMRCRKDRDDSPSGYYVDPFSDIVICFPKIFFFDFYAENEEYTKKFFSSYSSSKNMVGLRKLELFFSFDTYEKYFDSPQGSFRGLKELKFVAVHDIGKNWKENWKRTELKNLESLIIEFCIDPDKDVFFTDETFFLEGDMFFQKIKKLGLFRFTLKKEVEAVFPCIENLELVDVRNLTIIPESHTSLKKIRFVNVPKQFLRPTLERSSDLVILEGVNDDDISYGWNREVIRYLDEDEQNCWFFSTSVNRYEKLKEISVKGFLFGAKEMGDWDRFRNQVVKIESFAQDDYEDDIFIKEFPSLQFLEIIGYKKVLLRGGMRWECSKNLRSLIWDGYITDEIFKKNSFPALEILKIRSDNRRNGESIDEFTGKGWENFPSLKLLFIDGKTGFGDAFFQEQLSTKMEILYIADSESLEGKGWNECFSHIEVIEISRCKNFGDTLFQTNDLESLKKLGLFGVEKVTGIGWREMKNLRSFSACGCYGMKESVEEELYEKYNY